MELVSKIAYFLGALYLLIQAGKNFFWSIDREESRIDRIASIGLRRFLENNSYYIIAGGSAIALGSFNTLHLMSWLIAGLLILVGGVLLFSVARFGPENLDADPVRPEREVLLRRVRDKRLSGIFFLAGAIIWLADAVPGMT